MRGGDVKKFKYENNSNNFRTQKNKKECAS